MVESLVAMLVLTPLLFAIVQLSALQRAEQAALGAARAAAFAAHQGVDGPGGSLSSARLRSLYFADEVASAAVVTEATRQPDAAEQAEDISMALIVPALAVGAGDPGFPRSRAVLARAWVTVPSTGFTSSGDDAGHRIDAGLPLMLDDWDAEGVTDVWRRTAALSTTGRIAAWRAPLSALAAPVRLLEPSAAQLCPGRIDPDIVPDDRLRGLSRAPDLRTQPC